MEDPSPILLPVACRFIPHDQWLVTHLDPAWKIKQVKLWVLAKCLNLPFTPPIQQIAHVQDSLKDDDGSRHRPASPITFAPDPRHRPVSPIKFAPPSTVAARQRAPSHSSSSASGGENDWKLKQDGDDIFGYEEDDECDSDDSPSDPTHSHSRNREPKAHHFRQRYDRAGSVHHPQPNNASISSRATLERPITAPGAQPASSATQPSSLLYESIGKHLHVGPHGQHAAGYAMLQPPNVYTVIRFSTGQILEDDFLLSWYDLKPFELIEIHGGDTALRRNTTNYLSEKEKEKIKQLEQSLYHPTMTMSGSTFQSSFTPPPSSRDRDLIPRQLRLIHLDRTDTMAYAVPYWEGWVRALRVVMREDTEPFQGFDYRPGMGDAGGALGFVLGGAGYVDVILRERNHEFVDVDNMVREAKRERQKERERERERMKEHELRSKSGKSKGKEKDGQLSTVKENERDRSSETRSRRTKLEWRDRWVVIRDGVVTLCKDREDMTPTHRLPLSSLTALRGADHLAKTTYGMRAKRAQEERGHFDRDRGVIIGGERITDDAKIICAKFRVSKRGLHNGGVVSTAFTGKHKDERSSRDKSKSKERERQARREKEKEREAKLDKKKDAFKDRGAISLPIYDVPKVPRHPKDKDNAGAGGSKLGTSTITGMPQDDRARKEKGRSLTILGMGLGKSKPRSKELTSTSRPQTSQTQPWQGSAASEATLITTMTPPSITGSTIYGSDDVTEPTEIKTTPNSSKASGIQRLDNGVRSDGEIEGLTLGYPLPVRPHTSGTNVQPLSSGSELDTTVDGSKGELEGLDKGKARDMNGAGDGAEGLWNEDDEEETLSSPVFAHGGAYSDDDSDIFGGNKSDRATIGDVGEVDSRGEREKRVGARKYGARYGYSDIPRGISETKSLHESPKERVRVKVEIPTEGPKREREREKEKDKEHEKHNTKHKAPSKDKDKKRDSETRGEWIVLDMGDEHAYASMLRILHRHFPPPFSSSFVELSHPKPAPTIPFSSSVSDTLSQDHEQPFWLASPAPSEKERRSTEDTSTISSMDNLSEIAKIKPKHPATLASLFSAGSSRKLNIGAIPYPEWRLELVEKAQRAGMGRIGKALECVLWGDYLEAPTSPTEPIVKPEMDVEAEIEVEAQSLESPAPPDDTSRRPTPSTGFKNRRRSTHSHTSTIKERQESILSFAESEGSDGLGDVMNSDDDNSEAEWQGWTFDLKRQVRRDARSKQIEAAAAIIPPPPKPAETAPAETPQRSTADQRLVLKSRMALEPTGIITSMFSPSASAPYYDSWPMSTPIAITPLPISSAATLSSPSSMESLARRERTRTISFGFSPTDSPSSVSTPSSSHLVHSHSSPPLNSSSPKHSQHAHDGSSSSAALHHSVSMFSGLRSDLPAQEGPARRPSMPVLTSTQTFSLSPGLSGPVIAERSSHTSAMPVGASPAMQTFSFGTPPNEVLPHAHGSGTDDDLGNGGSVESSSITRRASSAGLMSVPSSGSLGRTSSVIARSGLLRKKPEVEAREKEKMKKKEEKEKEKEREKREKEERQREKERSKADAKASKESKKAQKPSLAVTTLKHAGPSDEAPLSPKSPTRSIAPRSLLRRVKSGASLMEDQISTITEEPREKGVLHDAQQLSKGRDSGSVPQ